MKKEAFNKENITELFSQLKKIVSRELGSKYNQEINDLSKRIYRDMGIIKEEEELSFRVAYNFTQRNNKN